MNHEKRTGNISSSQVYRVMGTPKVLNTYLKELSRAKRMGCYMSSDSSARSLTWGKLVEKRVFDLLPIDYKLTSKDTIVHPEIERYVGSPDGVSTDAVFDIKCPYTRTSFCDLSEICEANDVELFKKEYPEYYWQLVSNAILTNKSKASLIFYLPYQKELDDIREMAMNNTDVSLESKLFWLANGLDEDLPHQPNESGYNNMYALIFEVTEEEKQSLIEKIKIAVSLL